MKIRRIVVTNSNMERKYALKPDVHLRGFTLVELMIVIILLGILVAAGLASYVSVQKKSRDSKRKNDLRQIAVALETYYNDKGHYPTSNANGNLVGCYPDDLTVCDWGVDFMDEERTIYMLALPGDVLPAMRYFYIAGAGANSYQLYARLENTQDTDIPKNPQDQARVFSDVFCNAAGTVPCNHGVASGNIRIEEGRTISYE